jgi:hypothetical protein
MTSTNYGPDHFDISSQLSKELELGHLHLDLSTIGWPSSIQDGLNRLSTAIDAIFILYIVGTAAVGLAILSSVAALFPRSSRLALLSSWGLLPLSFLPLLIASVIITIVQAKAVKLINRYGNGIGLYASKGGKYLILTWAAVVLLFLAGVAETMARRNDKKTEYTRGLGRGLKAFGRL